MGFRSTRGHKGVEGLLAEETTQMAGEQVYKAAPGLKGQNQWRHLPEDWRGTVETLLKEPDQWASKQPTSGKFDTDNTVR